MMMIRKIVTNFSPDISDKHRGKTKYMKALTKLIYPTFAVIMREVAKDFKNTLGISRLAGRIVHLASVATIAFLLAGTANMQSVQAATVTVTNTNDSGAGSLRQALVDASDGDTIDFSITTPATITLSSGELLVNKSITVAGPGADLLSVNGNGASRLFFIGSGQTVSISGLTITNGLETSGYGGGIYNDHATLTVSNCAISGNSAGSAGGGIVSDGGNHGSAILTINNCTISGNSAGAAPGGGIFSVGGNFGSATLAINNSTVSDNLFGGISSTTFAGGSAILTVNNSTFSDNSFANIAVQGGASASSSLTIGGTILKNGTSNNIGNNQGTVTSLGYNLSDNSGQGFLTATGDQIDTDPLLGPLQDNGGSTFTHELLTGSPAVDMGDPNFTPPPDYDQRGPGFPRVVNGRIDIGAFEVQPSPTPTPTPSPSPSPSPTPTPSPTPAHVYSAQIQQPINANGSSVFNGNRGVIPVKFTLTLDGLGTCQLPPATIAVTRTAGGVTGSVNELVYAGNADSGSNFRIDSCQYIYNLNSRGLGAGMYRIDIKIDNQVVGSATFELR
jgi:hypothetical protein